MRASILGFVFVLAACASGQSGEDVARAPAPPSAATERAAPAPAAPAESVAAPGVTLPPEPAPPPERPGDITVPGAVELPDPGPADTRTNSERRADIRAWDNCVMRMQNQAEDNPMRATLTTPEEACSRRLGMASRLAVPDSRRR